ncbi:hypothetical protein MMC11_001023 [Xylographa trunciseda]|nr:hypothetical protein [Xylographa trunciseda]
MSSTNNADFELANVFNVKGKIALVTGGGSGIGLMCVQTLAVNGAKVYIVGRTEEKLENVVKAHGQNIAGEIIPLVGDITSKSSIKKLVKEIESKEKHLDILINNAGISSNTQTVEAKTAEEMSKNLFDDENATFEDWTDPYRTNVAQVFFMTTAFLPLIAKATEHQHGYSGTVINISSISGLVKSSQHHFSYNASKGAAIHLTKLLASEVANNGVKVRINSIAPGVYPSEMTASESDENQKSEIPKEKYAEKVPAQRPGRDQDMAGAILFAATNQYLNGQIVVVDGGYLIAVAGRFVVLSEARLLPAQSSFDLQHHSQAYILLTLIPTNLSRQLRSLKMENAKSSVVEIDPKGDVVLVLNCQDEKKKLLVSSRILSMVSPVFAAMLNSQFKEGLHNVTPGISHKVSLPDDDAIAFEIICNVIHYRHKHVPIDPSLEQLVNIAVIADKYELREPLFGYSVVWLQSGIKNNTGMKYNAKHCNTILFAAYALDAPEEFARISWEIVLNHVGPYLNLPGITGHDIPPNDMMAEFDARTAKFCTGLVNAICDSLGTPVGRQREMCSGVLHIVPAYISDLQSWQIWPPFAGLRDMSLNDTYEKLLRIEPKKKHCGKGYCNFCDDPKFSFAGHLRSWKESTFAPQFGICLDCVKTGRESLRKKECRVKHS